MTCIAVTNAVTDRCELASGRYTTLFREEFRMGRDSSTIPDGEIATMHEIGIANNRRLLNEIANYIVEAKAGNCQP